VPNRRVFEMTVIVVVLMQPALAMVKLWTRKHILVTGNSAAADAAKIANQII
jgi:hypothetical protein